MEDRKEKSEVTAMSMDQKPTPNFFSGARWLTNSQLDLLEVELKKGHNPILFARRTCPHLPVVMPDVHHPYVLPMDMLKKVVSPRVEYLPDDVSYKMGKADGMEQLKTLLDDVKEKERKLTAARKKYKQAQGKVEALEKELVEKIAYISRIRSARKFYAKCRDFARDYCKNVKDSPAAAARELMAKNWFIDGIEIHNSIWVPKESSGAAIGHTNEATAKNLTKDILRWRSTRTPTGKPKTPWKLPFED